ncbi:hypothetical protein BJ944DRAFT_288467 [Cunninghamella echinulata]|nr:hypothetical protein BJ944DRAFT_288467 [Cunninghamella echinulata]
MVEKSRMTLHKLARWHPSQSSTSHDRKIASGLWEGTLQPIEHEDLKQGALYIIKIHHVSVGLFQGWNDDMCCFAVLRSENTPMRWSQARYLPGDFDAFDAFDEAGNPPVHLWTRYLRVDVPINWFTIFEEARRKQREWTAHVLGHPQPQHHHHHSIPITSAHTIATGSHGLSTHNINNSYPMVNKPFLENNNNDNAMDDDFTDHETYSAVASQSLSISNNKMENETHDKNDNSNKKEKKELSSPPPLPSSPSTLTKIKDIDNNKKLSTASTAEKKSTISSSTTILQQQQQSLATPSQKLEMALEDISFPHDDDRFSIHSDYQMDITKHQQLPDSFSYQSKQSPSSSTWRKSSIKKMLRRYSNPSKP